jgi:ABC-type branched-subunit amino acid transport system substrate-binding protein
MLLRRGLWSRSGVLLLALSAIFTANCTLVLDTNANQCSADGDCSKFEGSLCDVGKHVCVRDPEYCASNAECLAQREQPHICHKDTHRCFPLLSASCQRVLADRADLNADGVVFLGSLTLPSRSPAQNAAELSVDLARKELSSVGFLPGSKETGLRPVAVVSCDPQPPTAENINAVVQHLTNDVRIAGILGPADDDLLTTTIQAAAASKIPVLSAGSTGDALATAPGRNDILFRLQATDTKILVGGTTWITQIVEPRLHSGDSPIVPQGQPVRLAMLFDQSIAGSAQYQAVFHGLMINGKAAADNAKDAVREFDLLDGSASNVATVTTDLEGFQPNVIVALGSPAALRAAITSIEGSWPMATPKPFWWMRNDVPNQDVAAIATKDDTFPKRAAVVAHGPATTDPTNAYFKYQLLYNQEHGSNTAATPGIVSAGTYDAVYLYFYAMASLGDTKLTPEAVAGAIRKVTQPNGRPIKIGQDELKSSLGTIVQGGPLTFQGILGVPHFDPAGDNTNGAITLLCIDPAAPTLLTASRANIADGRVVGVSKCF